MSEEVKVYSLRDEETRIKVAEMEDEGLSVESISIDLGIPKRTIYDFLAENTWKEWWDGYKSDNKLMSGTFDATRNVRTETITITHKPVKFPFKLQAREIHKKDLDEDNSRVLLISDMHIPYHHPDTLKFLAYLKAKYNPTRIICLGDELDKHALSFHDSDPDLPSAGDELKLALPVIKQLKDLFPVMDILESNHGSLVYRKAKHHGIPRQYLKSYNDVLGVDDDWQWWFDMTIDLPNGSKCYLHHGKSSDVVQLSQQMGMNAIQGHYHEKAYVGYWANPNGLFWGLQAGCLINDSTYAFNYNNCNIKRPIISTALIIDSMPVLEPMILDQNGDWVGENNGN